MNCPIDITDYESSLIAADWYEENGFQDWADQIRYSVRLTPELGASPQYTETNQRSGCHSRIHGRKWMWSRCGERKRLNYTISRCSSRSRNWYTPKRSECGHRWS